MTIEQKRRELFEAKYPLPENVIWNESTKSYFGSGMRSQWWLYQDRLEVFSAALDAVVIQLPTVDRPSHAGTEWIQVAAQDEYKHRVTAAIEQTGLGLKVMP